MEETYFIIAVVSHNLITFNRAVNAVTKSPVTYTVVTPNNVNHDTTRHYRAAREEAQHLVRLLLALDDVPWFHIRQEP